MKGKHILKAVASGIIWGLGQVFNRQYIKALFFFLIFVLFVVIEIGSSKYFTGYDPYDKVVGTTFTDDLAQRFYDGYQADVSSHLIQPFASFDDYCKNYGGRLTMDQLIEFIAQDLIKGSPVKYYVLSEEILASDENRGQARLSDLYPDEDKEAIDAMLQNGRISTNFTTYQSPTGEEYKRENRGTDDEPIYEYVNISNPDDKLTTDGIKGYVQLDRKNKLYLYRDTEAGIYKIYVEVEKSGINREVIRYDNVIDYTDSVVKDDLTPAYKRVSFVIEDALYYSGTTIYGYYNPETLNGRFKPTNFSKYLSRFFIQFNKLYQSQNQNDFAKFNLQIYFAMHPDLKQQFETTYDNFYYDRAGFFLKGLWSIVTLGTAADTDYYQVGKFTKAIDVSVLGGTPLSVLYVDGHMSSFLLIKGLISTLLLAFFIIFYVWSIRDAYKTSVLYDKTHRFVKDRVYFKELYEHAFEYIVLSPAIFIVTFISVMPIIFGFIIAFTTYNGASADVGLFNWAENGGFGNFLKIFSFGKNVGLDFGKSFWSVFLWTVIWAIFSTLTVFFGGFLQAIVINSERVPLRKFWRTLLILPWAIPALISQMVLANFFDEMGVVNEFLNKIGLEAILREWQMVGLKWQDFVQTGLPSILFLGEDHIQWISNPHNIWFVRTMLIVINIWLGFPYYMALMSSVMAGIDKTLYEAADIDGANKTQKFRFITFPLVLFSTAPLLVMCFSGNFNNFGVIYFITQGGENKGYTTAFAGDTDILISWMYTLTIDQKYYNIASVFSILIFFIVGSIAAWNYARTKSFQED